MPHLILTVLQNTITTCLHNIIIQKKMFSVRLGYDYYISATLTNVIIMNYHLYYLLILYCKIFVIIIIVIFV